jgi:hypothetical protein
MELEPTDRRRPFAGFVRLRVEMIWTGSAIPAHA